MTTDKLTATSVAAMLGIQPVTFRAYVSRGQAPPPDGRYDKRTPYWLRSTIETWQASRPRAIPTKDVTVPVDDLPEDVGYWRDNGDGTGTYKTETWQAGRPRA